MELLEWNASVYDSLPLPHQRWGAGVIERLAPVGDETVLDVGCGTGRDAGRLLEALPNGRVIAVDGSQQMLEQLRARLTGYGDRLRVVHADLREPLDLGEPVDAAISVATLHWLPDHDVVFRNVARVLRPGGRFVAEGGGFGNITGVRRAVASAGGDTGNEIWNFATLEETSARLANAGFVDANVALVPDPARLNAGEQLETYLATVVLGAQLREMPIAEQRPFVHAVAEELAEPVIDYVRLQISAVRR
ncbi:MAG: class I SAM-dependent methyltransferase [Acidothermaceae bacterium]